MKSEILVLYEMHLQADFHIIFSNLDSNFHTIFSHITIYHLSSSQVSIFILGDRGDRGSTH